MSIVMPEPLAEGRFQLLEVIGEGGMATVYRAFDQRLQRPRAIKVLSPALCGRPALRRRFMAEAQTMATLEESRVVRIFDVAEEGDRVYIVMELVDGGSLLERVRDYGPLTPRMAARVGLQICESLQAAHDAGVIHRDIKPHNILLTRTGEIRITDFGIAQVQVEGNDGLTKTGAVMGTWGFMAPEQKSDAKGVDARADIYAVGATLWSLLRADTPPELFMADQEAGMMEGIPDALSEVIRRATRYRREERYPSVRAMADSIRALSSLLPEDPEHTPPLVMGRLAATDGRTPVDTVDQLRTPAPYLRTPAPLGRPDTPAGTMVPDLGALPEPPARPPAGFPPPPALAPLGDAGATGVDLSFTSEGLVSDPPAPPDRRPLLYAGVGLMGIGLAAVIVVGKLWSPDPSNGSVDGALPPADAPLAAPLTEPLQAEPAPSGPSIGSAPGATPPGAPADPAAVVPSAAPPAHATPTTTPAVAPPAAASDTPTATTTPAPATDPAATAAAVVEVEPAPEPTPVAPAAPRAPSTITHTPPTGAKVGETVVFAARFASGYSVKLYYRVAGTGAFKERTMSGTGGDYSAGVKIDPSMLAGLDYFLAASDDRGNTVREGSAMKPLRLAVTE